MAWGKPQLPVNVPPDPIPQPAVSVSPPPQPPAGWQGAHITLPPQRSTMPVARRIAVFSSKGGVGKTGVAVNLAAAAQTGLRGRGDVALADCDPQFGALAKALNLPATLTWSGFLHVDPAQLGPQEVAERLVRHPVGFSLLFASGHVQELGDLTYDKIMATLKRLAECYTVVIADCGDDLDDAATAAIEWASDVVLVMEANRVGMSIVYDFLQEQRQTQAVKLPKVHLVLNKVDSGFKVPLAEIEQRYGCPVLAQIPQDPAMTKATNAGEAVVLSAPNSPAARAIQKVAKALVPEIEPPPESVLTSITKAIRFRWLRR